MCQLIEKFEVDRKFSKLDSKRCAHLCCERTAISKICKDRDREDSVISLTNSKLNTIFDVVNAATSNRYADVNGED